MGDRAAKIYTYVEITDENRAELVDHLGDHAPDPNQEQIPVCVIYDIWLADPAVGINGDEIDIYAARYHRHDMLRFIDEDAVKEQITAEAESLRAAMQPDSIHDV